MYHDRVTSYWMDQKAKVKKYLRVDDYEDLLETIVKSTFDYKGFPTDELPEMIEEVNLRHGKGIIWECDGYWIATEVTFDGTLTPYGFLSDAIATSPNGKQKTFKDWMNNKECVVFMNNCTWTPDFNIGRFSDYLANIDISEEMLVLYSRIKPLLIAHSEDSKKALDHVINDLTNGKVTTVLTDGLASMLKAAGSSEKVIDTLSITDVTATQWLQYLSKYHDDILSRFYFINGMDVHKSEKMAQQSVEEVTSGCEARMVIPINKLEYRKRMVELCRKRFEWDCSVDFSHCWKHVEAEQHSESADIEEEAEDNEEN